MRIDRRFRGPPNSGNGGYIAGLLARELGGFDSVVTLRMPPPLDCELRIEHDTPETCSLVSDDGVVALAVRATVEIAIPAPPSFPDARAAEARFAGLCDHNFPGCFVCGPERAAGDGLRIFPGALDGSAQVAATWTPDASLADANGRLPSEFIWAALDCTGYFAVQQQAGLAVLGRIGATLHHDVALGAHVIVSGWPIASDGRKHRVGTALHDRGGRLLAAAEATWISLQR
ncbi:MAG: hypothetical protein M3Q15_03410 [Pseudomonadota bacterium]|nr:hypothetical protein [Pseudomonadota bacterium]